MKKILGVSLLLLMWHTGYSQKISRQLIEFKPDDWISYPVMRFVTSIDQGDEYIYFGTTGGVCRYNFYKKRWDTPFTRSNGMINDRVRIVLYDFTTGYVWCLTEGGLCYRIPTTGEWFEVGYPAGIGGGISDLGAGERFVWFKKGRNYYKGDRFGTAFTLSEQDEVILDKVRWNSEGEMDIESLPYFFMDNSQYIYDPRGIIKRLDLREYPITYAFKDNFRSIWVGTDGLGSGVGNIRTERLRMLPFGPYYPDVQVMAWDGYSMWMGGISGRDKGGITRWDQKQNSWKYYEALYLSDLRSDNVNDILVEKDTSLVWFATDDGLALYNKTTDKWTVYDVFDNLWDNYVTSLARTGDVLWIGTASGLNRMQEGIIKKADVPSLDKRRIYRLEGGNKTLWAGSDKGKYAFDLEQKKWSFFEGAANVQNIDIYTIDNYNGEVWFAGDMGMEMFDIENTSWEGYSAKHYPVPAQINALLNTEDIVWIASEEGLVKFVKNENRWRFFTVKDGLLHNSVRWILPDGDFLWLGSPSGISQFYWNAPYRID